MLQCLNNRIIYHFVLSIGTNNEYEVYNIHVSNNITSTAMVQTLICKLITFIPLHDESRQFQGLACIFFITTAVSYIHFCLVNGHI